MRREPLELAGTPASPGLARGRLVLLRDTVSAREASRDLDAEARSLHAALAAARAELERLAEASRDGEVQAILEFQIAMLEDDVLDSAGLRRDRSGHARRPRLASGHGGADRGVPRTHRIRTSVRAARICATCAIAFSATWRGALRRRSRWERSWSQPISGLPASWRSPGTAAALRCSPAAPARMWRCWRVPAACR